MQQHRVARYPTRSRAFEACQRFVEVIHPQRDVGAARITAPRPDGPFCRADVLDQLDDPPVASVEVCDLQLDRVLADKRRNIRIGFGHPLEQPETEPTASELNGAIKISNCEPNVIDGAHYAAPAARSRSGTMSRPRTSSTVSRRFTTSAVAPQTRTVAGRGRPLKFAADAS